MLRLSRTRPFALLLALSMSLLVFLLTTSALGAGGAGGASPTTPTTTTMVITLLAVLAGYITQAVNTGSFLGLVTVPKPLLPWLSLVGLALAAFVSSMVSGQTLFASIVAALLSLTGTTVGVTVQQHTTAHLTSRGQAAIKAAAVKVAGTLLLLALAGCLYSAPIVPVTPANQAQVASCQQTAVFHDGDVIVDFGLGGISSALAGSAAAVSDQNTKTDLAVVSASVAALVVVGAAIAELTASNFANSNCSSVVGPLPTAGTTTVTVTRP